MAGRVWAIYETVLNREPRHGEMAAGVARLASVTTTAMVSDLLVSTEFAQSFGGRTNAGFAELMYRNSVGWIDQNGINHHALRLEQGNSRATVATDFVNWRLDSLHHADRRAENGGFFVPRPWVDALDDLTPTNLGVPSFGLWWADQIIQNSTPFLGLPDVFNPVLGLLPQLSLGGSRLEELFLNMAGAPAESRWATSFLEALQKTGVTPSRFLQDVIRDWEMEQAQLHLLPQGTTFQAGW